MGMTADHVVKFSATACNSPIAPGVVLPGLGAALRAAVGGAATTKCRVQDKPFSPQGDRP